MQLQKENSELQYNRFCSYSVSDVIGLTVQNQYLYIVQPHKISVYEYHGNHDKPQLSEELILNNLIQHYSINQHYICTHSPSLIEVRDRKHWGNVIYINPIIHIKNTINTTLLQQHFLYLSSIENNALVFQKIDLETKETVQNINLGKADEIDMKFLSQNNPIFLSNLGKLNDFYILGKSDSAIEFGMLYKNMRRGKKKFEINEITHEKTKIHKYFHYKINCLKYPNQSPQFILLIASSTHQQHLHLQIHEIIPKDNALHLDNIQKPSHFQQLLHQFTFLATQKSQEKPHNLINEILEENMPDISQNSQQNNYHLLNLADITDYENCIFQGNRLWISSRNRLCIIQFLKEEQIQNILKSTSKSWIIRETKYEAKEQSKKLMGVYRNHLIYQQNTISYLIAQVKEPAEEIAQEIEEYEVNDEILQKQTLNNMDASLKKRAIQQEEDASYRTIPKLIESDDIGQVKNQVNDIPQQNSQESKQHIEGKEGKDSLLKMSRQFEVNIKKSLQRRQFGIQTDERGKEKIQLNEIKDLIAKYSSTVSTSCIKVKQSQYFKEKIDKDIFSIVDNIAKNNIEPFLENKFIAVLQQKIKEISLQISYILQVQMQSLNENMRKIQIKQSNLKGRKIFQFSSQINHMKQSVEGFMDAIKSNEVHKYAFHQIVLEEARSLKEKMAQVEASVAEIQKKSRFFQQQVGSELAEIYGLLKVLQQKESGQLQDGVSEEKMSAESLSQRDEQSGCESSQDQSSFQEEMPRARDHHSALQRGYQPQKKNKSKLIQLADNKGYSQYHPETYQPVPPNLPPYYYPFMPPTPHFGYQPYYPPINYPYHSNNNEFEATRSKARPVQKKVKRTK